MDIKRLKEIETGALHDLVEMLPEIIERLILCRNCKNYVPQDQWTETSPITVGGIVNVYDPAYCGEKNENFGNAGKCGEFELK